MGARLTKQISGSGEDVEIQTSAMKLVQNSTKSEVKKGVNVSGGKINNVVGVKQTIVNNINKITSDQVPKLPSRTQWNKLIKRHRREESWIYPFPWDHSIRLAPEDFFVQLSIAVMDRTGEIDLGYEIELRQLFDPVLEGADRPEHILIRGDAGYGKSTMCIKVAFDWAQNVTTFRAFPATESLVILYRLRDLPPGSDLEEELRTFVNQYHSSEDGSISSTQKACWKYGNKLLLILDGYDEISHEHQKQIRDFLSQQSQRTQSFFKFASVIVTSRPDTDQDLMYLFDKHCRLTGLSEERRLMLVNNFMRRYAGSEALVLTALNQYEDPRSKNLSPLLILMVCYMSKQGGLDMTRDSSELSLLCIKLMAKRCNEREALNLTEDDINTKLLMLGKFFYKCLSNNTLFIRATDMRAFLKEHYEFAVQFGILVSSFQSEKNKNEVFEPIHKQFMDSLAKYYLQEVWSSLPAEERQDYVSDFVDSLSTEIWIIQGREPENKIKISAKDKMHRANRITYVWEVDPETGNAKLDLGTVTPMLVDLGIKITLTNQLNTDVEFFVTYITNAFSGVSGLKMAVDFLAYFRQHIYRVKFCRVLDDLGCPCQRKSGYISELLDYKQKESEDYISFVPWSTLTLKINLIEVEVGEPLLRIETLYFVCGYLLGLKLSSISLDGNASEFFTRLYRSLCKCHQRFYVKCVLKKAVGSKMFRMMTARQKKVDLITFQCNYKHEHVHPREVEIGENDKIVPTFRWENIRSVILYFSK